MQNISLQGSPCRLHGLTGLKLFALSQFLTYQKIIQPHLECVGQKQLSSDMQVIYNPDFLRPSRKSPLENILGKGENAGNQHFLFFPKCFLPFLKQIKILS